MDTNMDSETEEVARFARDSDSVGPGGRRECTTINFR